MIGQKTGILIEELAPTVAYLERAIPRLEKSARDEPNTQPGRWSLAALPRFRQRLMECRDDIVYASKITQTGCES